MNEQLGTDVSSAVLRAGTQVQGDIHATNVIIGDHNLQLTAFGGKVTVIDPSKLPAPQRIAKPVYVRPREPQPFTGRHQELALLRETISNGAISEIVGPHGSGKTWLLRKLAQENFEAYPDGLVYPPSVLAGLPLDDLTLELFDVFFERFASSDLTCLPTRGERVRGLQQLRAVLLLDDLTLDAANGRALTDYLRNASIAWTRSSPVLDSSTRVVLKEASTPIARALVSEPSPAERAWLRVLRAVGGAWLGFTVSSALAADAAGGSMTETTVREGLERLLRSGDVTVLDKRALPSFRKSKLPRAHADPSGVLLRASERALSAATEATSHSTLRAALSWFTAYPNAASGDHRGAVLHLLKAANSSGLASELMSCVRAIEGELVSSGAWGSWGEALEQHEIAARSVGDVSQLAWAHHERGVRALCLSDLPVARAQLRAARRLRKPLRGSEGFRLTDAAWRLTVRRRRRWLPLWLTLGALAILPAGLLAAQTLGPKRPVPAPNGPAPPAIASVARVNSAVPDSTQDVVPVEASSAVKPVSPAVPRRTFELRLQAVPELALATSSGLCRSGVGAWVEVKVTAINKTTNKPVQFDRSSLQLSADHGSLEWNPVLDERARRIEPDQAPDKLALHETSNGAPRVLLCATPCTNERRQILATALSPDGSPLSAAIAVPVRSECARTASCNDGVMNGKETDKDCGGPEKSCARCSDGLSCIADDDCISHRCLNTKCSRVQRIERFTDVRQINVVRRSPSQDSTAPR